jgi:hypothetical protein
MQTKVIAKQLGGRGHPRGTIGKIDLLCSAYLSVNMTAYPGFIMSSNRPSLTSVNLSCIWYARIDDAPDIDSPK